MRSVTATALVAALGAAAYSTGEFGASSKSATTTSSQPAVGDPTACNNAIALGCDKSAHFCGRATST